MAQEPTTFIGKKLRQWDDALFKWRHGVSKETYSETVQGNTPLLKLMSQLNVTEKEVGCGGLGSVATHSHTYSLTHSLTPIAAAFRLPRTHPTQPSTQNLSHPPKGDFIFEDI